MTSAQNALLSTPEVDRLVTLIEEATRATKDSPRRFIEPARGTLDRAKSKRHHLVFGRRGSGKTSLLRKAGADLTLQRTPTAFVDLEAFKGHTYPDVLLSVLIETLNAFQHWLSTAAVNPATKTTFWQRLFGGRPKNPPLDRRKVDALKADIAKEIADLTAMLHSTDGAEITRVTQHASEESASQKDEASIGVGAPGSGVSAKVGGIDGATQKVSSGQQITEAERRAKIDFLHRKIIDFQKLIERIGEASGRDAFIFFDDLYHIARSNQADVLDYFHRILKGRSAWLKVGTIRHRTEWYRHGNPPVGIKLGDDCDDIDLDITLEKYQIARTFLLQILDQLVVEAGLESHKTLLADGGVERLVLASGGVARDFLTIFRRAIEVARERGTTYRGDRINAEDVNTAAGEHDSSKRDELKRDTIGERSELEFALRRIQEFCIQNQANCFLVERDRESRGHALIGELVDLRFVHVARTRSTARELPGKLYTAYMLDISQYTGERKRRELQIVNFWEGEELDRIRSRKYVLEAATLEQGEHPA